MTENTGVQHTNRDTTLRLFEMINTGDFDRFGEVLHPDSIAEFPQSGERVRGLANFTHVMRNYPGGRLSVRVGQAPFVGDEGRYVLTPMFTMVKVEGAGDTLTARVKTTYPDGSDWFIIAFLTFRDAMIQKQVLYYAPVFDAPQWRAQWVEPMTGEG